MAYLTTDADRASDSCRQHPIVPNPSCNRDNDDGPLFKRLLREIVVWLLHALVVGVVSWLFGADQDQSLDDLSRPVSLRSVSIVCAILLVSAALYVGTRVLRRAGSARAAQGSGSFSHRGRNATIAMIVLVALVGVGLLAYQRACSPGPQWSVSTQYRALPAPGPCDTRLATWLTRTSHTTVAMCVGGEMHVSVEGSNTLGEVQFPLAGEAAGPTGHYQAEAVATLLSVEPAALMAIGVLGQNPGLALAAVTVDGHVRIDQYNRTGRFERTLATGRVSHPSQHYDLLVDVDAGTTTVSVNGELVARVVDPYTTSKYVSLVTSGPGPTTESEWSSFAFTVLSPSPSTVCPAPRGH